ncbi:MAG: addiction module protein [Phycisphaerae bacterium]
MQKAANKPRKRAKTASDSPSFRRLLRDGLNLQMDERHALGAILLDSVGDGAAPAEIAADWDAEIERRVTAFEAGKAKTYSHDDAMRAIFGTRQGKTAARTPRRRG